MYMHMIIMFVYYIAALVCAYPNIQEHRPRTIRGYHFGNTYCASVLCSVAMCRLCVTVHYLCIPLNVFLNDTYIICYCCFHRMSISITPIIEGLSGKGDNPHF